jgi:hypothetical protein
LKLHEALTRNEGGAHINPAPSLNHAPYQQLTGGTMQACLALEYSNGLGQFSCMYLLDCLSIDSTYIND